MIEAVEAAEATRRGAADRLAEGETRLAEADRAARAALEALSAAREASARAEERQLAVKRRLGDLVTEIAGPLQVEPGGARGACRTARGGDPPDIAEVEADLERFKRDRERLGAVNLRADEELREVEAQHANLGSERDDLVEAIKPAAPGNPEPQPGSS